MPYMLLHTLTKSKFNLDETSESQNPSGNASLMCINHFYLFIDFIVAFTLKNCHILIIFIYFNMFY